MTKRFGYTLLTFAFGVIFGATVALVLTPWRGEEVRDRLSKVPAERKLERVRKKLEKLEEKINEQLKESKSNNGIEEQTQSSEG